MTLTKKFNSPLFYALAGAVLIAALFYDVILGLGTFVIRDYSIFAYPLAQYHRDSFWNGEIPLWNPYSNTGIPFLAQWSTLVLYPGSLIYLVLPMPWSLGVYCLVHLWFGVLGMFLLARHWTGNNLAASVAALGFAFNGFSLNCLSWPAFLASLMWMPWVVWLATRSFSENKRTVGWAVHAGAMQMLTGGPEVIFLTWFLVGCLWIREIMRPRRSRGFVVASLPAIVLLVAILCAAQLLPFFDLLASSQRGAGAADSTWAMPKWGFANLLVPLFRFYQAPNGVFFQTGQDWTSSYYLGIGVLFLAVTAMIFVRNFRVQLLAILGLASLLLSLGENSFAYPALNKLFPQLGFMRYPIKFMLFAAFAFPLLAAFGAAALMHMREKSPRRFAIWTAAFGGVLVASCLAITFYGKASLFSNESWPTLRNSGFSRIAFLLLILATFYGLALNGRIRQACAVILPALFLLDPWTHAPSQNPRVPLSVYQQGVSAKEMSPAPKLGESRAMMTRATHDRIYGSMLKDPVADYFGRRVTLFGNSSLIDKIPNVDGFFSLYLQRPRQVWSALFFSKDTNATRGLADFLGVSHVSDPEQILGWARRSGAMPLITAGQRPILSSDNEILKTIASSEFGPREDVYLSTRSAVTNRANAVVEKSVVEAHAITATINTDAPTLAVISQSYDPKWKAYLDNSPVPILRANYAFQAVGIPAGTHQLTLRYEDRTFRLGVLCSFAGLAILLLLLKAR